MNESFQSRLVRSIQIGLLILVGLMPFHAFLSVSLGHVFGHESLIQAWKEALTLLLAAAAIILAFVEPARRKRLSEPWVVWAAGFALTAIIVSLFSHPSLTGSVFGIKTDLEFLVIGAVAALVASPAFVRRLIVVVIAGSTLVIAFGLAEAYLLPANFLAHFGYGPSTVAPYQTITSGVSSLRFPSTLGGANQLGTYLILPLCLTLYIAIKRRLWLLLAPFVGGLVVLVHTYSRSAWVGAFLALLITLVFALRRAKNKLLIWIIAGVVVAGTAVFGAILAKNGSLQYYLLHSSAAIHSTTGSDAQHALSLEQGLKADTRAPLGHGLGTAGPATFHTGTPNIIENYYLQIGYECGLLGLILFVAATIALTRSLLIRAAQSMAAVPAASAVIGVSLAALVLPAWTDSSTAIILWAVAGTVTGLPQGPRHV